MRRVLRAGVGAAVLALLIAAVASGSANSPSQSSTTLVFGAAADPVVLDAALISDGESFRVVYQITETLVGLRPGTTQLAPMLATGVEEHERRKALDVHASPQRRVPRRNAIQRGGRVCELQPLVQLQGRAAVFVGVLLLQLHLRRLQDEGREGRALQELQREGLERRRHQPEAAVRAVPRRDDALAVRDAEPGLDEGERGQQGSSHVRRRLPAARRQCGVPGGVAAGPGRSSSIPGGSATSSSSRGTTSTGAEGRASRV